MRGTGGEFICPDARRSGILAVPRPEEGEMAALAGGGRGGGQVSEIMMKLVRLCEAFNAHDLDRIMGIMAEDCVLEMPRGPEPWGARFEGREAVRAGLATRFEGLPDVHYGEAEHLVDEGRQTGISKWTLTGTMRDGRRLEVRGCDFYSFRDGLVVRKDSYWKIVEEGVKG
jgi:ketosteroid isomerase-like protein